MSNGEIVTYEMPEVEKIKSGLQKIKQYQAVVQDQLVKDLDYGIIPGTSKPTLLKPGAEKLAKIHSLSDSYEILHQTEDWDKPFFEYTVKCILSHIGSGVTISEGLGSCNSYEKKYRNQDIFSIVNTLLKMAKKRALVDATLSACRLSAVFTQDLDEIVPQEEHINPPQSKSHTTTESEILTIDSVVEKVEKQTGKNKAGIPWIKYHITAGGQKFTTFDMKIAEDAKQSADTSTIATITFKTTKFGNEIETLTLSTVAKARAKEQENLLGDPLV